MSKILHIKDFSVFLRKEKKTIVDTIDFSVEKGSTLTILGESGSGKTMTCNAIMGILDRKKFKMTGEILYNGKNLFELSPKERRCISGCQIAFIPQNPMTAFDPSMKIGKQMMETLRLHRKLPANMCGDVILDALEKAGLPDIKRVYHSFPHELSGGMLQRVMIAMVLMLDAQIVIADEPTTALDVVHRNETIAAFRKMVEDGTSVIMVTHDFAAAVQLGGDMLIMKDGKIIEKSTTAELFANPKEAYTKALIEASLLSVNFDEVRP